MTHKYGNLQCVSVLLTQIGEPTASKHVPMQITKHTYGDTKLIQRTL